MPQHKREYTIEEGRKILDYIIANESFCNLRGNAFWKQVEKQKVLKRTWQSMKEHFRMKIINNLKLYNISRENERKIVLGYSSTKRTEFAEQESIEMEDKNIDFSDEEKPKNNNKCSTLSDDSDDSVLGDDNMPCTFTKGFKKQPLQRKSKRNILLDSTKCIQGSTVSRMKKTEAESIDIIESSSISDTNSDNLSCNVSSTNLDATFSEFSIEDDKKFLLAITKHDSNLLDSSNIVTFIKQYRDFHNICKDWTEIYDRFIEILNNLQLYSFLPPEMLPKLAKLKEPLEKYRSVGFKEAQIQVLPIKVRQEIFSVTEAPNSELIYLNREHLHLLTVLEKHKNIIYALAESLSNDEISDESVRDILGRVKNFTNKFESCIVENDIVQVRRMSSSDLHKPPNEIDAIPTQISEHESDIIPVESAEISVNLPEISNDIVNNSQYLEDVNTEDLNAMKTVGKIMDNDLDESDFEYLTCET